MYCDYFSLNDSPFSITPDPSYLYMGQRHQEALAHLLYGLQEGGGFVQLTGEVGTGKTTLIRALLEQLPNNIDLALIFNPKLSVFEFLAAICDELHIGYTEESASIKTLVDALNRFLLEAHGKGRRVVLVVDEAQNLHCDVLEQIRLLTNLETAKHKLLQIILVGQPELREILDQTKLRQLAQRITARYHLMPMSLEETRGYITHRLKVAGASRTLFTKAAMTQAKRFSDGVPRIINVLCDRALLGAYSIEAPLITAKIVKKAANEVAGELGDRRRGRRRIWLSATVAIVALLALVLWQIEQRQPPISETTPRHDNLIEKPPETRAPQQPKSAAPVTAQTVPPSVNRLGSKEALYQQLKSSPDTLNQRQAFSALFTAWGAEYANLKGANGCERAVAVRLQCYFEKNTWQAFQSINRPAIIWLSVDGKKRYFTLLQISQGVVTLDIAGVQHEIQSDLLGEVWRRGNLYILLWRPPALDAELIKPNYRGSVVLWLRRNLEQLQNSATTALDADLYNPQLQEQVVRFQKEYGLVADGLAGKKTFIQINTLTDRSVPLLIQDQALGREHN